MYVYMYICSVLLTHTHTEWIFVVSITLHKICQAKSSAKASAKAPQSWVLGLAGWGFWQVEVIGLPVFRYIRQNDGNNTAFRGGNDVSNFLDDPDFSGKPLDGLSLLQAEAKSKAEAKPKAEPKEPGQEARVERNGPKSTV